MTSTPPPGGSTKSLIEIREMSQPADLDEASIGLMGRSFDLTQPAGQDAAFDVLTSTPPPQRPATLLRLESLFRPGTEDTSLALMRDVLALTPGYGKVTSATGRPLPLTQRGSLPPEVNDLSLAVVRLLIWAEFSSRLKCAVTPSGGRWSLASGIPESRVTWVGGGSGTVHLLPAVPAATVLDDVRRIVTAPSAKLEARSQNESPELMMLLAFKRLAEVATQRPGDLIREYGMACLLVDVVADVVALVVHQLKHLLQVPRPTELLQHVPLPPSALTPLMAVPKYRSFPGGHAALASALATVLDHLVPSSSATLTTLADRIAQNRVKMGFHTETDTRKGHELGVALGNHLLSGAAATDCPLWSAVLQLAGEEF